MFFIVADYLTQKSLSIFGFGTKNITPSILLLISVVFIFLTVIYAILLWKTYHYKITDKGVYFKGGLIIRKEKFIPFFKITNAEVTQTIFDQLLGIYSLGIQTAGTGGRSKPEILFGGLIDTEHPKQIIYKFIKSVKKSSKYSE